MLQKHLANLDLKFKISIVSNRYPDVRIYSPMPEQMTMGVGSEIGSPFAGYATDGKLAQVLALSGISHKVGIVTTKMFMGPDNPDISLDLKFETYHNAKYDVLFPAINLMTWATSYQDVFDVTQIAENADQNLQDIINDTFKGLEFTEEVTEGAVNFVTGSNVDIDLSKVIKFLKAPPLCHVYYGTFFTMKEVYLSNVSVSFANTLDPQGIPTSATATVTLTNQNPLTFNSIAAGVNPKLQEEFQNSSSGG